MNGLEPRKYTLYVEHDFSTDGGAVGAITLRGGGLPKGAVITSGVIRITSSYTSGGSATVALKAAGTADLLAATAVASLSAGLKDIKPDGAAANMVLTTDTTEIVATVAVAALTAGKMKVALDYFILDA